MYRTKENPNILRYLPSQIEYNGVKYCPPLNTNLDKEIELHIGYYVDITPVYDHSTHQTGEKYIWNEVDGTVIVDIIEIPLYISIPKTITRRQGDMILEIYGLYDIIQNIKSSLPKLQMIEANSVSSYDIDNPLLVSVTTDAGMTQEQLNTMFYEASYL